METASSIFPLAYGNEEETGLLFRGETKNVFSEPHELIGELDKFIPGRFTHQKNFLSNGFKIYNGGSKETNLPCNLERATPECSSPSELVRYIRAGEVLLRDVVKNYVNHKASELDAPVEARIHRRVVDSKDNRKACHDNYQLSDRGYESLFDNNNYGMKHMLEHLLTTQVITGAGIVTESGLGYSQKLPGLSEVEGYGYYGTMYRVPTSSIRERFEVRCSDINISDWAVWQRIGGTALVYALNQTELRRELRNYIFDDDDTLRQAKRIGEISLTPEGQINSSNSTLRAIDFQQKISELVINKLTRVTDEVPAEYYAIAKERYAFCTDFKKVLQGDATIDLLADRADWAAKFALILARKNKDAQWGIDHSMGDYWSRSLDLHFDHIKITGNGVKPPKEEFGYGYKMRNKGIFKRTVADISVAEAYSKPPQNTRAKPRSELIAHYPVSSCDWHYVEIANESNKKDTIEVFLRDVGSFDIPKIYETRLAALKEKKS